MNPGIKDLHSCLIFYRLSLTRHAKHGIVKVMILHPLLCRMLHFPPKKGLAMKYCDLLSLSGEDYRLGGLSAVLKRPPYRQLNNRCRQYNGFLLIEEGNCHYAWEGGEADLRPGSLIYLPFGSRHRLTVKSDAFAFRQVDFTVTDAAGELLCFSSVPHLFFASAPAAVTELFREMTALYEKPNGHFRLYETFYALLSQMADALTPPEDPRIEPVLAYLRDNYTREVNLRELATLTYLSRAQLYRMFLKATGLSPTAYRNRLRIEKAKHMLRDTDCTVGEISVLLGFDSIYYFSRVFRQLTGMTPTAFRGGRK